MIYRSLDSTYSYLHTSIHTSIHTSFIHLSIYLPIYQSIYLPIYLSIDTHIYSSAVVVLALPPPPPHHHHHHHPRLKMSSLLYVPCLSHSSNPPPVPLDCWIELKLTYSITSVSRPIMRRCPSINQLCIVAVMMMCGSRWSR